MTDNFICIDGQCFDTEEEDVMKDCPQCGTSVLGEECFDDGYLGFSFNCPECGWDECFFTDD